MTVRPPVESPPPLVTKPCPGCGRRILVPKRGGFFDLAQWCAARCAGRAPDAQKATT